MNAVHSLVAGALAIAAGLYPTLGLPIPNGLEVLRLVAAVAIGAGYFAGHEVIGILSTPSWWRIVVVVGAAIAACLAGWTYLGITATLGAGPMVAMFLIVIAFLTFFPVGVIAGSLASFETKKES